MLSGLIRRIGGSLLLRVVLALAVVAIVPLAFVSIRLIDLNRDALETQVLQTHAVAASTIAQRFDAWIESWRAIAITIAESGEVSSDPRSPGSISLMQDVLATRADLAGIVLTTANGEEILRLQKRGDAEAVSLLASSPPTTDPELRMIGTLPWIVVNQPMPSRGAWVRLVAAAPDLSRAIRPEEIGQDAAIALVDSDGTLLMGARDASFPVPLIEAATAGRTKGAGRFGEGRDEVLGAHAPVPGTDWAVVSRQPATVAEEVAIDMRDRAWIAIGIAAVLVAVLTALAWFGVVRPIRQIVSAQRRLEGLPVDERGGDIDQLKLALEALERRIRDRQSFDDVFLGRYQILNVLGEGGMGTVFRGWDPKLHREVALKTIRLGTDEIPQDETLPDALDTLLGEAITVAKFNDPNIVSVYDVEKTEEAAFISMELVEGESLEALLSRMPVLPPSEALSLGLAVAKGLRTAHQHGVVHHDLKPANVLISSQGAIKIADFGIAGLLSQMGKQSGMIYGTPGFLPPEAITESVYDPVGDLFSLGVILYRCLSGRHPFLRSTVTDTLVATVKEQAPDLPRSSPEVDGEIDAVVKGLMMKDPVMREITTGDLVERLQNIVEARRWRWTLIPERSSAARSRSGATSAQYVETMSLRQRPV